MSIRQTIKICEKSMVRIILLNTPLYLLNFFRFPFLLKWTPNLLKYYKFNSRKSENFKIRHCLIDQATARSKSGGCLIDQTAVLHPGYTRSGKYS